MRIIVYEDHDKKINTWEVPEHIAEIWDIYIEENNITETPDFNQFSEFLVIVLKVRRMFPDKFPGE